MSAKQKWVSADDSARLAALSAHGVVIHRTEHMRLFGEPGDELVRQSGFPAHRIVVTVFRLSPLLAAIGLALKFIEAAKPMGQVVITVATCLFAISALLPYFIPERTRLAWLAREFNGRPKVQIGLNGLPPYAADEIAAAYGYHPLKPNQAGLARPYVTDTPRS
ncbi:hypothetical protein SAMN05421504_115102 [Amycolatopsis xylanica]|uniref:Uncharacterized protein n=1 Tax=Amycolatopsis xylanica TaxID=589385 RepID=A0A1H3SVB4_9PSEU|nr:hypothetical protein [Amycolatopsis xylanica]SDZ41069.1 hypothetical protein SAMN05421504_115102 [Amycolatopsis xylanica]